jgi:hypothetical protein
MTGRKNIILLVASILLVFTLHGCVKVDTLPQLEIIVLDENGTKISGASAALFSSLDEWNKRINPVQVWRKTDADGKVLFIDLDEIKYFVYVRYDGKDNSLTEVSTEEALTINQRNSITIHIR